MEVINQPHRHVAATLVLVLAASPLVAHHGWSDVDQTKVINLTGTVKRLGFENPHVFIELEVPTGFDVSNSSRRARCSSGV
jgi:hypothetical protein